MGKITLKVAKTGHTYLSDDLQKDGFVGDVEGIANAATVTLIKPGSSLDDVEKSLRLVLRDVALRKKMENREK